LPWFHGSDWTSKFFTLVAGPLLKIFSNSLLYGICRVQTSCNAWASSALWSVWKLKELQPINSEVVQLRKKIMPNTKSCLNVITNLVSNFCYFLFCQRKNSFSTSDLHYLYKRIAVFHTSLKCKFFKLFLKFINLLYNYPCFFAC